MKLKCYFAIVFSMLVLFTFSTISQAQNPEDVRYRGTFDTWLYTGGEQAFTAKVVRSFWHINLSRYNRAWFHARYLELNVDEETPGTYDKFIINMVADNWEPIGNGYLLEGTAYFWKNGMLTYQWDTQITIDPEFYEAQLRVDINLDPENIVQIFGSLLPYR